MGVDMIENKEVKLIKTNDIVPNRFQPRQIFDEKELNELADSIKEHGIIQPLILRPLGEKYEIIAGERRYKAALIAGFESVPSIVIEANDNEIAEIAIIENIQRKDLTPIEEAKAYKKLVDMGLTQEEIAKKLGITQPTIANKIRLLNLSEEVQNALLHNKISERHARGLLRLESPQQQADMLNRIINERINVKETEEEIDKLLGYNNPKKELEIPVFEDISIFKPLENDNKINNKEEIEILSPFTEKEEILTIDDDLTENFEESKDLFKPIELEENRKEFNIPLNEENNKYKYLEMVETTREFIEKLKSNNVKIISEEYDMDNEYQIIIKIEK